MVGEPSPDVGEPNLRVNVVEFCWVDERVHKAALGARAPIRRIATTFCREPNRVGRVGRILREADPPIVVGASEGLPVRQYVVDRLSNRDVAREVGARGTHPVFERVDHGSASSQATILGAETVDVALDVEECVDAFDGLEPFDIPR
jgi:hypothetical protein